jgi:hypothetical protein
MLQPASDSINRCMQKLSLAPARAIATESTLAESVPEDSNMTKTSLLSDDPAATLAAMRKAMKAAGVNAFIVPSEDPHMSEYPPDCCNRRVFVSGFTGSSGTAVVTDDKALLWTDGRCARLCSCLWACACKNVVTKNTQILTSIVRRWASQGSFLVKVQLAANWTLTKQPRAMLLNLSALTF